MALLLVKSVLFGHSSGSKYMPVRSSSPISPTMDIERGERVDSAMSSHIDVYPEKHVSIQETLTPSEMRVNPRIIADATIGLSDGLTVPFALTAGLSALGDTKIVVYGGLAELIAGGISMGLGGYLGARSEAEAYHAALSETQEIVYNDQQKAAGMVRSALGTYEFTDATLESMNATLLASPRHMVEFLMRFHHQLAGADFAASRAYISGLTISAGYFFGGLVPLLPYFVALSVDRAFLLSVAVMAIALFAFGWLKTSLIGERSRWICFRNAMQMMLLGGVAAGAAMGSVKAIGT